MTAPVNHPPIVVFSSDYTSPKFKVTGYKDKTVVVTGHLTLPKDSTFSVTNLVNLGKITTVGDSIIEVTGALYNFGEIKGNSGRFMVEVLVQKPTEGSIKKVKELGIPIILSDKGIQIPTTFLDKYS